MTGIGSLAFEFNGPTGLPVCESPVSCPSPKRTDSSDEDSFCPSSQYEENQVEQTNPGFFGRIFQRVINYGRKLWKSIRKYNPFTLALNFVENIRVRPHVERAASRNEARTNEEIRQYHESLSEEGIFRAYLGNGDRPRPLVVLFLGNGQTLNSPENEAGILRLTERLRRDRGVDILVFRAGSASNELRHRFCIGGDPSLHTSVVYQHSLNVIEDYIKGRGIFTGRRAPSRVVLGGYSFGGGSVDRLLREDWQRIGRNIPVTGSVYIDAIRLGSYDLGDAVEQRPPYSAQHLNFYQQNSNAINGNHVGGLRPGDASVPITAENHTTIDDSEEVQNRAYRFIRNVILN